MSEVELSESDLALLQTLEADYFKFLRSLWQFHDPEVNRVELIRRAERSLALELFNSVSETERAALLPTWVRIGFSQKYLGRVLELLASLPEGLIRDRLEDVIDQVLNEGDYLDYMVAMSFYEAFDMSAEVERLVTRAISSPDPDVREWGDEHLKDRLDREK